MIENIVILYCLKVFTSKNINFLLNIYSSIKSIKDIECIETIGGIESHFEIIG
jgi:hypothetical protein